MEQNSYKSPTVNPLLYKNISIPAEEITDYIDKRRRREIRSLQTRWYKFNELCMGGIEPNCIYTFCGITGSGKSSFVNSLETDLFDLNPKENFCVLSFNYEMLSARQLGRKLSYKLRKTTSELYSGSSVSVLSDKDFDDVQKEIDKIKKYEIYYVDNPGTVEQMRATILKFSQNEGKGKWVLIILDHTLLTRGRTGDKEREILSDLERMFMEVKKFGLTTVIQLSQMNRNIESTDRITNRSMHYPIRSDIFGSESVMQTSDYLFVIHRPELLGINNENYGPYGLKTENLIYLHCLKNREGGLGLLTFSNNLKYNRLEEVDLLNVKNTSDPSIIF